MQTSRFYILAIIGLLASSVTTTPLNSSLLVTNPHHRNLRPRDDTLWPPQLPDWPFPANKTDDENKVPEPEITPLADNAPDGRTINTRKQLSKVFLDNNNCNSEQKNKIFEAWDDARLLNAAQTQYQNGYPYNIPHTQWLGKDWNSEGGWWGWYPNYRQRIQNTFGRAMSIFGDDAPKSDYLFWSCKDLRNACTVDLTGATTAYTWSDPGWFWSNHYTVFCGPFFGLPSVSTLITRYQGQPHAQKVMDFFEDSRGGTIYHEIFHTTMITNPLAVDLSYGAKECWKLAKEEGTKDATINADSYHLDAMAIYVQQTYKMPRDELRELDPAAFAATEDPKRQKLKTKLLQPSVEKLVKPDTMPDPKDWMEVTSKIWRNAKQDNPGSEPRGLKCLQKEWTASKETTTDGSTPVKAAIEEFCKNHNGQKIEKRGDRIYDRWDVSGLGILKRSSVWLSATTGPFNQCDKGTIEDKDCIAVLSSAMNSCDKDQLYTAGVLAQGEGCIEYAIEVSSSIHEGDPPWDQHVKSFPPPETVRSDISPASLVDSQIVCSKERGSTWSTEDAEAAIEEYCGNDLAWSDGYSPMSTRGAIKIAASWTNGLEKQRGYSGPYKAEDKDYCYGFDSTKKSQDDCRYAFRKITRQKLQDHAFCLTFYRCVGYLVIGGKFNDALNIEKASFTDDVTDTFVASNFTTDNGYVADIIAKLGVKSFE